ncbi:MAG: AMP-binding protein [Micrococcales bacterium]
MSAIVALADALAGQDAVFISETPNLEGAEVVADQIALVVESSGSTGIPKRIELSRAALIASATASDEVLGGPGQWLLALPINFIAGANVLIRSLVSETQPVLMNTRMPFTTEGFSRAASMQSAERRYTSLVPTQLKRLLDASELDEFLLRQLQRFDAILVGGQAVDASLVERCALKDIKLVISYGMSETCGGCVYDGRPLPGVEVRISDAGEIEIAGPTLAEGVATAGWYRTHDLGEMVDGKLVVLGRSNRVLNSGGLKVSLDRIEEAVREIGGVAEAAALALPDKEWGERAAVVYVGSPEIADYIATEALVELGPAAKPVRVIRVAAIPKLVSGKTDYLSLATHFE